MKQPIKAALYMRLSKDDAGYGDSISIENQRSILRQYAKEHNIFVYDEYVDDGYSGTNFDRPDFKRMMADIDAGKVNCVITKDLSRFGREHIQTDFYLEFDFPERGIRYIAVSDNEDTEKGLSDFASFKNLFNEWYAKDTSRKVKTSFNAKFLKGERIFTYAPIGYRKDPDNKCHLLIDEETRWIIEKIFDMAYHGAGAAKITNQLIAEQVPTPAWLHFQREKKFARVFEGQPESKRYEWTVAQVKRILHDETYIGNSVHYQQTSISFKSTKRVRKPKEDWTRIEGTHEPIIDKDVFDHVQELIDRRRRKQKDHTTQIFSGLVKCADCGWSMRFATNSSNKTPYSHFTCTNHAQRKELCSSHYIRYDVLYPYVLGCVRYWAQQAQQDEEKLLERLLKASDKECAAASRKNGQTLKAAKERLQAVNDRVIQAFEDRASGIITEYTYSKVMEKYQKEQAELERQIAEAENTLDVAKETTSNAEKWVSLIKQYTDIKELTAPLLNALIDKIVVHEAVKGADGTREQEVEIFYRFIGKIDE